MKRWLLLIFFNGLLTGIGCWVTNYNSDLKTQTKDFVKEQKHLERLLKKNDELRYPWREKNLNVERFLSDELNVNILCSDMLIPENRVFQRPNVSFEEGYISGYLWCEDCHEVLKKLTEQDFPLWIKTLSINRDVYDNYNLQFSVTYEVGKERVN